jgi:hypothetical protein
VVIEDGAKAEPEGAEVHGDVRGVDDEPSAGVEKRAGKVGSLLDVRGEGRTLKAGAHLGDDVLESIAEEFLLDAGCRVLDAGFES